MPFKRIQYLKLKLIISEGRERTLSHPHSSSSQGLETAEISDYKS